MHQKCLPLAISLSLLTVLPAAAQDTQPPSVSGTPTVAPPEIDLSDGEVTVKVTVTVTDDDSGVQTVFVGFSNPNGGIGFATAERVSGTAQNGVYEAEVTVRASAEDGTYNLDLTLADEANNFATENYPGVLTVTGGDQSPPEIIGEPTVVPDTIIVPDNVDFSSVDTVTVTVELSDPGTGVREALSQFADPESSVGAFGACQLESGDKRSGTWVCPTLVLLAQLNTPAAPERLQLTMFVADEASNTQNIETNVEVAVVRGKTPVTFNVDMRLLERLGLFSRGGFLDDEMDLYVDIQNGPEEGQYELSDALFDSVWSTTVGLTPMDGLEYSFVIDPNADGLNLGDWVFERPGTPRTVDISSPIDLEAVPFDDQPVVDVDLDFAARIVRAFGSGPSGAVSFDEGIERTLVTLAPGDLQNPALISVRRFNKDPGGSPPSGIATISSGQFWVLDVVPSGSIDAAALTLDFGNLGGISDPSSLRLLRRDEPSGPWGNLSTDVDASASTLTATAAEIAGSYTLGSESAVNTLVPQPPVPASQPIPADGAMSVDVNTSLSWTASPDAISHDVFLWREDDSEPSFPVVSGLEVPTAILPAFTIFRGETYIWYVVSKNLDGEVEGPRWTFSTSLEPDLVLSDVIVPGDASSGQEIELQWTVTNSTDVPTNQPFWTDDVLFSADASFIQNFERLGRFSNPTALGPGESYAQTATVRLPEEAVGPYFIQVVANGSEAQGERDRSNNAFVAPIEIAQSPLADLLVSDIQVPPNAFSGEEIDVEWTITNDGEGDAVSPFGWNDIVYLTEAPNGLLPAEEVKLQHFRREPLAAGESYTVTETILLPARASGTWFVVVRTNDDNLVYERGESQNNLVASSPIDVTLSPPPDLVPSAVTGPADAIAGSDIEVAWTVTNRGPGPVKTGTWIDRLYLVADDDPDDRVLLSATPRRGSIAPDSSYRVVSTVRLPDGLEGAYVLRVETDWADAVFEHTFENNNAEDLAVNLQRPPYPDLSVTSFETESDGTAGSEILLQWSVRNVGDGLLDASWIDRVYVSSSQTLDTTAVPLLTNPAHQALTPGASYDYSQRTVLPADLDGSLFLHIVADDDGAVFEFPDDRANNLRTTAIEVSPYPPVDVAVTSLSAPTGAQAGQTIRVEWTVQNLGEAPPPTPIWNDVIYLSSDTGLDPMSDPILGRVRRGEGLAPGASYDRSAIVRLPDAASGQFNILVHAEVSDSDDSNNVAIGPDRLDVAAAPAGDLRVVGVEAPATAVAGQPVTMTVTVANDGPEPVSGTWTDAVYLSFDRALQIGDVALATHESSGPLAVGSQYEFDVTFDLPGYVSGTRILLVSLDDGKSVVEGQNESNNTFGHQVSISLAPPSDLQVSDVQVPDSAIPGRETVVQWTLTNSGPNRATGNLRDAVYISADREWQVEDPLVGTEERFIDLAPGASTTIASKVDVGVSYEVDAQGEVSALLPGVPPGGYYAIVRADVQNSIRETDDGNNALASSDSIQVDIEALPLGGSVSGTLLPGQSRYYKVDIPDDIETIELSLEVTEENSSNELFVSDGRVPTRANADVRFTEPFASSLDAVVPRTSFGHTTHYVLLFGRSGPDGGTDYTLSATALQFELNEIDLAQGGEGGDVTIGMSGSAFVGRVRAFLENESISIRADEVVVANSSDLFATFDLRDVPLGGYDVVLEKDESELELAADSTEIIRRDTIITRSILPLAFNIVPKVAPEPFVETQLPDAVLVNREFNVVLEVTNHGNIDLASPLVFFMTNPTTYATIDPDEGPTAGYKRILMTGEAPVAGILRPGQMSRVMVNVVAPPSSGALKVFAGLARMSGQPFELDRELEHAHLNQPDQAWVSAVVELEQDLRGGGWRSYEQRLARAASLGSRDGFVEQDGSKLLLNVLQSILQSQRTPAWSGGTVSETFPEALSKSFSAADPCTGIGEIPTPGTNGDCRISQLIADKTALTCVAAGLAAPGICGGVHGAEHLLHFLNGDGSKIVYDNESEMAAKLRSHPGLKSFESIHKEVTEKIQSKMTDLIRDLRCEDVQDLDNDIMSPDELGIEIPKPKTYMDSACKAVPYYDPFDQGVPGLDQLNIEQPGCDLVTAFGGFQSATAFIWNMNVRASRDPGAGRCDEPGCTVIWEAIITYRFGDKYEFDPTDRGAFDDRGRNLQLCGEATPFETEVELSEPIGGIVRVPPQRNECPEPPDLPPFLFDPPGVIPVIQSFDPNDIVGPAGAGDERWVAVSATLPYRIRFENDPERATAPAQAVAIEQILPDSTIDIRSFRLGEFGFGDFSFQPPPNSAAYSERIDLSDSLGFDLDVNAGLDIERNRIFWVLRTLDPATGRPPSDPFAGFLPVNDSLGSGEGFVAYTVRPNPDAKTGDVILAQAEIVFDRNEPIETPEVFNTIDAVVPESFITETPFRQDSTTFEVRWSGRDDPGGSGVGPVDLYVSKGEGPFELFRQDLQGSSVLFNAEWNERYSFYTLTSDRAGNREPAGSKIGRVVIVGAEETAEIPNEFSLGQNYPNPFNPSTTVPYGLPENADVSINVYTILGQRVLRYKMDGQRAGLHTLRIDMYSLASGVYFYQLEAEQSGKTLFTQTRKMVFVK